MAHTPGPWRWEVSPKSHSVALAGGRTRYDLHVMDFVRWGMGGAQPRLLDGGKSINGLMLLDPCTKYAVPAKGREHHADWFLVLDHPDANLIAAAPELLEALKAMAASHPSEHQNDDLLRRRADLPVIYDGQDQEREHVRALLLARAAIAKAEGRP